MNYISKYYQRLKKWHASEVELGPTEKDLEYNPVPFTPKQEEAMQSEAHDIRLTMEERNRREEAWRRKRFEDTTDKDTWDFI